MNTFICFLSLLLITATLSFGDVDHDPLNNGTTLARNACGHTFEAALLNPALLGVQRAPRMGLMFPGTMLGVGVWSNKLSLSPFNRFWNNPLKDGQDVSTLVTNLFNKSFDLGGLDSVEVSTKLTKELKDGLAIYARYKQSLVNFGINRIGYGIAFDVSTHFDEEINIPGAPFMMIFSETDGLQTGNTLDLSSFHQEGAWVTDFTVSFGLPVTIPALNDFFKMKYGSGGVSVKYIMGHSVLKATSDRGTIYSDDKKNEITVDGRVKIQTAGSGLSGEWNTDHIFNQGLPVSGHGFGIDLGGILYDEHGTLTVNFSNLGAVFWTKGVKEATYQIPSTDLTAYDVIKGIEDADKYGGDPNIYIFGQSLDDSLTDAKSFATLLPMAFNIGYSYSWNYSEKSIKHRLLTEYVHAGVNYEQALAKAPARRFTPRISIGGEAGTLRGILPLRLGLIFGGSERIASALGVGINCKYLSLNASYKAIGHPFFIPKRGMECAVGLGITWGMNSDQDNDSIPDNIDKCRSIPEDRDGFEDVDGCPEYDNDGDSIPDTLDKCINVPEDWDNYNDTDGCPDYDNDGDSIVDTLDKCPLEPEDIDNFEDSDGCPDRDNDGDHIVDSSDKCPNNPEDIDGKEDDDGCPEFDNDSDGIPDSVDNCMNVPEIFNGFQDEDGCPDTLIRPSDEDAKKLTTKLKAINFRPGSAELLPVSYEALNYIADFLKNYETLRYEIQGHTDSQGSDETNLLLSAARASAVRSYLLSKAIPESRLVSIGYGETMPVADNITAQGRAQNRRVEFKIIETNNEYEQLRIRETEFNAKIRSSHIKGIK